MWAYFHPGPPAVGVPSGTGAGVPGDEAGAVADGSPVARGPASSPPPAVQPAASAIATQMLIVLVLADMVPAKVRTPRA
jgi:hypothetical protein